MGRTSYPSGPNKSLPVAKSGMVPGSGATVKSRAATKHERSAAHKADGAGRMVPGAGKLATRTPNR